ncbi:MAG: MBL fold metallo-hydrolase [Candidatus Staskawiczbacteria bacterium]|nr:MBL fold metallo-hydrolase [Candidatus Staskawiczbacteria bacterium]
MAAVVKILVEGFTNADSVLELGEERTQPTITLVRDDNLVMVVDPGILDSRQTLIDALEKENLTVDDVNVVCVTHSHIDHYRNVGMFPNAKILEYFGLWEKNKIEDWDEQFTPNIRILRVPGHDYTDIALFVKTEDGIVAICGDVFWKENYPQNLEDDTFASDYKKLGESRELVLKMANLIIPGHGKMYKNDKIEAPAKEEIEAKLKESKVSVACRKCGKQMIQKDRCKCRPWLCYRCCECHLDCDNCSCSHKKK